MKLQINGKQIEVSQNISIFELLKEHKVESPEMVSVELNEEIIERENFDSIRLLENDRLEFLYFMGGGAR